MVSLPQRNPQLQDPAAVQIDPKCLHSVLKQFFDPLRTDDPRTDFFAMYRRESDEFDRDYAGKYDEDLNTSLIFAGLFSAASSAFIIDVQSKLEPDPNEVTAAYLRILIHNMDNSIFPDTDPSSTATWTGPPSQIVTVQALLYSSLAISLFAAYLAMLGKQWVNRYLRKHGGSVAEKSRDRQRKLDGFNRWKFRLVIESLPVMLQLALSLFGCALSLYLWTISRAVAWITITFTLFGFASYILFTLAATFYYDCPYQTPPSILIKTVIHRSTQSDVAFIRLLQPLLASLPSTGDFEWLFGHFISGVRRGLRGFYWSSTVGEKAEHAPPTTIVVPPTRLFEDIPVNWEVCKGDSRSVCWVLDYTADPDVILSSARFAADMIWYPEIVGAVSPHTLADRFFDCLWEAQVIPGRSENASAIGMALASVLSTCLVLEPEDRLLRELCWRIREGIAGVSSPDPGCLLVTDVLGVVTNTVIEEDPGWLLGKEFHRSIPDYLSTADQIWLGRVVLQTLWRWKSFRHNSALSFYPLELLCDKLMTDGDNAPAVLKTTYFLILGIALGLQVHHRDLCPPNTSDALQTAIDLFYQRLRITIKEGVHVGHEGHLLMRVLPASAHLNPFRTASDGETGILLIADILDSSFPEDHQYSMASSLVRLLGEFFFPRNGEDIGGPKSVVGCAWIPPLLGFLLLGEKFYATESPPYAGSIAIRILSVSPRSAGFGPTILPILSSTLLPAHPLQSRGLSLRTFYAFAPGWFSSHMESIATRDLESLVRAVGDPFLFAQDDSLSDGPTLLWQTNYEPISVVVILIEFASSELWRNHLRLSNFTTSEEFLSTEEGRRTAIKTMLDVATGPWPEFLCTATKVVAAISCLVELQCLKTAEVVIMWAWTVGIFDPGDPDGWRLIERNTLFFYRTHGIGRLGALKRHITDSAMDPEHVRFLDSRYEPSWFACRVTNVRRLVPIQGHSRLVLFRSYWEREVLDLRVSQVCQLKRLYHLFGYDPRATAQEAIPGEGVGEEVDVTATASVPFVDWG